MKFVSGYVTDIDEAVALVLRETGRGDISQEAADLFLSSVDSTRLQTEGDCRKSPLSSVAIRNIKEHEYIK